MKLKLSFGFFIFGLLFALNAFAASHCNPPTPTQVQRSQAFLQNTPCAPVVTACNSGGYVLNCHKADGKGLEVDCIHPLMKGTPVAGVSMQPTDPAVASCKTFCHSNKGACAEQKGVQDR
jgi:hypothetical protein